MPISRTHTVPVSEPAPPMYVPLIEERMEGWMDERPVPPPTNQTHPRADRLVPVGTHGRRSSQARPSKSMQCVVWWRVMSCRLIPRPRHSPCFRSRLPVHPSIPACHAIRSGLSASHPPFPSTPPSRPVFISPSKRKTRESSLLCSHQRRFFGSVPWGND